VENSFLRAMAGSFLFRQCALPEFAGLLPDHLVCNKSRFPLIFFVSLHKRSVSPL
jgi:hypothetical protein